MVEHPVCDVCSRTLLKGEEVHEYVNQQGERLGVCVLCRSRAEASGWIPAEQYGAIVHEPPHRGRRGQALRKRLGQVAARARGARRGPQRDPEPRDRPGAANGDRGGAPGGPAPAAPTPEPQTPAEVQALPAEAAAAAGPDRRPARPKARQPKGGPKRQPADEPSAPPTPRPRRGPEAIMRQAVERFNSSEERRKVAGLIRSLGEPQAAVLPDARRQLALVTVAWELSWYQWEVGANGDEAVREVAKGKEVSELADDARAWNAAVAEDGELRLRDTGARRPAAESTREA